MEKSASQSLIEKVGIALNQASPWIIFILGLWLVVIKPLGPHWEFVPGDLADARFNNFIIEHFFRWISGVEPNYWNIRYLYPYENVIAFSDNFLGAALLYSGFRWAGFDRETAFQCWYVLSFCFDYLAAAYVLSRFKFQPLAISIGAFFFTFGLPLLGQETHLQLFYRFGIPLACFFLWQFFEKPKLSSLTAIAFWLIWQFYLTIYLGVFLSLLLLTLAIALPLLITSVSLRERLLAWPQKLVQAWVEANLLARITFIISTVGLGACFFILMQPYYLATRHYGFIRVWSEISRPQLLGYLSADNSMIWGPIKNLFSAPLTGPEQQLFPGITVILLVMVGIFARFRSKNSRLAWLHFGAITFLFILTLEINGYSAYWFLWKLPGVNSLRAIGRIQLVLMWPLALFVAWVLDELLQRVKPNQQRLYFLSLAFIGLLIVESISYNHVTYAKSDAKLRLIKLSQTIPSELPENPVLFIADNRSEPYYLTELDAMVFTQEHGWATLNGYSSNYPPGAGAAANCIQIPKRIAKYMKFENISRKSYYLETIKRIVPVGFQDCDPSWWEKWPW